jgi:hypothetical protein
MLPIVRIHILNKHLFHLAQSAVSTPGKLGNFILGHPTARVEPCAVFRDDLHDALVVGWLFSEMNAAFLGLGNPLFYRGAAEDFSIFTIVDVAVAGFTDNRDIRRNVPATIDNRYDVVEVQIFRATTVTTALRKRGSNFGRNCTAFWISPHRYLLS